MSRHFVCENQSSRLKSPDRNSFFLRKLFFYETVSTEFPVFFLPSVNEILRKIKKWTFPIVCSIGTKSFGSQNNKIVDVRSCYAAQLYEPEKTKKAF